MPSSGRTTTKKKKSAKSKKEPTPPRERSLRACTRCRQRKQKCDNALPNCGNCVKGGVPCEAFPVNVVSRDNLMQVCEQLQESRRENADLRNELSLARLVVSDTLALFSAVILQKVTTGFYQSDNNRQSSKASDRFCGNTKMQSETSGSQAVASAEDNSDAKTAPPASAATKQPSAAEPDVWKMIELLEMCFPAVAAAICVAAGQPDQKIKSEGLSRLEDIASVPIRDLQTLLDGSTTYVSQGRLQGLNVDELTSRLIAANAITRIAATLLWALLAFVLHRSEELLRMDTALTCFMQAWQTSSATSSAVAMHDTVSMSFFRAYDWVHLQTAIMTGKLHIQVTTMSSFEGIEAIASKADLSTFLASFHVEQKRLEYVGLHLFTSPVGEMTDVRHEEAVWNLLSSIKDLSDVNGQAYDTFGAHYSGSVVGVQHVLMRHKLGTQLYGMFPRMLFMYCPNDRRHWRWLNNALPLAVTALSCHHAAWMQCGWLGDHAVDALTFADLLAAFVWTLQQRQAHNELRDDMHEHIRIGAELGHQFAAKWPQCSTMILAAVRQLCSLRESPLSTSGLSTPWPTASVATSHTASSPTLRTPQDSEPSHPLSVATSHPHDLPSLPGSIYHPPPHRQPAPQTPQAPQVDWQDAAAAALQPIPRPDWPTSTADQAFNSIGSAGLSTAQLLAPDNSVAVEQQRRDGMPVYLATPSDSHCATIDTRTSAALRALPCSTDLAQAATTAAATPRPTTATTAKTLLYIDDRSADRFSL